MKTHKRKASGSYAEKMFLNAWRDSRFFPEGMAGMKKAARQQDKLELTDFELLFKNGDVVPIQLKSGRIKGSKDFEWHFERDVLMIHISPIDTPEVIRRKTLAAISRAKKLLNLDKPPEDEPGKPSEPVAP